MQINELVKEAHKLSVEKGWHQIERSVPELLCLIHSELSEALEEYRNGKDTNEIYYVSGKPEGIPIELADAVIRIADLCGLHNIDLEEAIKIKATYNKTRSHRHGGKVC